MKKFLCVFITVLIVLMFTGCPNLPTDPVTYALGDTGPAGGLIFYVDEANEYSWNCLEAAPVDQTSRVWGTASSFISGADGTVIGTGKQNTLDIIANDVALNKAADECALYSIINSDVTYDDWFLPSIDELNAMYVNLHSQGLGGFSDSTYWTSSEYANDNNGEARWQDFTDGNQDYTYKEYTRSVRAVRAF